MSRDRRNGKTPLGTLPPAARHALEVAWLDVVAARYPEGRWLLGPDKRDEGDTATAPGEIVGGLAAPENKGAIVNGDGTTGATNGPDHHCVNDGGH